VPARHIAVIAFLGAITSVSASDRATAIIELGSSRQSPDGFRLHLDVTVFPPDPSEKQSAVPLVSFVAEVPHRIGKTQLGIVFLEVQGRAGQTVLSTSVDRRGRPNNIVRCSVDIEKRLARDCVFHFQYAPLSEPGLWIKDYVLRLKHHMAPTQ
jgi:hypothetical protein